MLHGYLYWDVLKMGTTQIADGDLTDVRQGVILRRQGRDPLGYCGRRVQERGDWRKVIAPQVIVAIDGIDCR